VRREITDILISSQRSSKETQCDGSDLEADSGNGLGTTTGQHMTSVVVAGIRAPSFGRSGSSGMATQDDGGASETTQQRDGDIKLEAQLND